jgi:hypothetical protein
MSWSLFFFRNAIRLIELLLDVIQRVESSETTWPARRQVVACAAVCWSWREVTKEVVKTLKECGRITFPMSLKQVSALFSDIMIRMKFCWLRCSENLDVLMLTCFCYRLALSAFSLL